MIGVQSPRKKDPNKRTRYWHSAGTTYSNGYRWNWFYRPSLTDEGATEYSVHVYDVASDPSGKRIFIASIMVPDASWRNFDHYSTLLHNAYVARAVREGIPYRQEDTYHVQAKTVHGNTVLTWRVRTIRGEREWLVSAYDRTPPHVEEPVLLGTVLVQGEGITSTWIRLHMVPEQVRAIRNAAVEYTRGNGVVVLNKEGFAWTGREQ